MFRCMRTTLTLDADVTSLAQRVQSANGLSFKATINEALRQGLSGMLAPIAPRPPYKTPTVDLGHCRLGSLDDVAEALAAAEGERFR